MDTSHIEPPPITQTTQEERPPVQIVYQAGLRGRVDRVERIQRLTLRRSEEQFSYLQTLISLAIPSLVPVPSPPALDPEIVAYLSEAGQPGAGPSDADHDQQQ